MAIKKLTVSSKLLSDRLYVDSVVADGYVETMKEQLDIISKETDALARYCKTAQGASGLALSGGIKESFKKLQKQLNIRKGGATHRAQELKSQYAADTQDFVINGLTKTVAELEKRIAVLEKNASKEV